MQLHEVFAVPDASPPPGRAVTFRVLSPTKNGPPRECKAAFAIVDEPETSAATRDAEAALIGALDPPCGAPIYRAGDGTPIVLPPGVRGSEQIYHLLFRALRDETDPRKPFARTVLELRKAIPPKIAGRLYDAYNAWIEDEFPDTLSVEALRKLEDDAAGK